MATQDRLEGSASRSPKVPHEGHVQLQLKGALSLCTEVLFSPADFHTDLHCACPWVVLLRTQPESREPAGLDPADISLSAESQPTNNHRKVQRDASLVRLWLQNWNCRQIRNYLTPPQQLPITTTAKCKQKKTTGNRLIECLNFSLLCLLPRTAMLCCLETE